MYAILFKIFLIDNDIDDGWRWAILSCNKTQTYIKLDQRTVHFWFIFYIVGFISNGPFFVQRDIFRELIGIIA